MATNTDHDHAPEVAPQSYPEAVPPQLPEVHNAQQQAQQQTYYAQASKPEYPPMVSSPQPTTVYTSYEGSHKGGGGGGGEEKRRGGGAERTVCGCTPIVFVLSVIVAILAAAVIGLAAGTGISASLARDANDKYQRLQASVSAAGILSPSGTGSPPPAASTSCPNPDPVVLDNGCSTNSSAVNGQPYTSFKLLSVVTYTMQCNKDVNGTVLYSLFAPDFNTCMDSCSGYTKYATDFFGTTNVNATCAGVSYIPLWTNKTTALAGGAPGNCYLKRGPLENKAFITPNAGTPVHGAIVSGA